MKYRTDFPVRGLLDRPKARERPEDGPVPVRQNRVPRVPKAQRARSGEAPTTPGGFVRARGGITGSILCMRCRRSPSTRPSWTTSRPTAVRSTTASSSPISANARTSPIRTARFSIRRPRGSARVTSSATPSSGSLLPQASKCRQAALFLLTNSGPEYTDAMMSFLLGDSLEEYPSWRNYFDYVVAAAKKPSFFTGKAPFVDLAHRGGNSAKSERGRMYTGRQLRRLPEIARLHRATKCSTLATTSTGMCFARRRSPTWRTAMIIQEMDDELRVLREHAISFERAASLRADAWRLSRTSSASSRRASNGSNESSA